jgi:pyridoxal phosphate enzyme (YggS family)
VTKKNTQKRFEKSIRNAFFDKFSTMIQNILSELSLTNTTLVAVSKTKPNEKILELYKEGQRIFGENRVQELVEKYETLPKDIRWHLIGHLQTNKVKYIAPFVSLIHSVDSLKLLKEINKQAKKNDRIIDVLLQFHIATETSKFGLDFQESKELLKTTEYQNFENIRVIGVMGMASFVDDESQVRKEFQSLKAIFEQLKKVFFEQEGSFSEISMGMSGDYKIAIEEGSTMVRIGSLLFGAR